MKYIVAVMTPFAAVAGFALMFVGGFRSYGHPVFADADASIIAWSAAFLIAYVLAFALFIALEARKRRAAGIADPAMYRRDPGAIWSKSEQAPTDWRIAGLLVVALIAVLVFMGIDAIL